MLKNRMNRIEDVYDMNATRLVCKQCDENMCYVLLGLIQQNYKSIPKLKRLYKPAQNQWL